MSWIQTYTGRVFDAANPSPADVCVEDVAHALALICRFNGHTRTFYSVAEHCVIMSEVVSEEARAFALMHDAEEAYLSDLARPLRPLVGDGFARLGKRIKLAVHTALNVPVSAEIVAEVKGADLRMLETERRQLMSACPREWETTAGTEPYDLALPCWGPMEAKHAFLNRYRELYTERALLSA